MYAIGNPSGLSKTLTAGVVSGLNRTIPAPTGTRIYGVIQVWVGSDCKLRSLSLLSMAPGYVANVDDTYIRTHVHVRAHVGA